MSKLSNNDNNGLSRRSFLKYMGIGAAAGALGACSAGNSENTPARPRAQGEMTYRTNHNTGDKVSILGYGCMRLPTTANDSARDSESVIDQEAVNRSVDYAMAHGVNYYDTSPSTANVSPSGLWVSLLADTPRDSYFLATKLSNFDPAFWPREKSIEMFNQSLENLQTDYIDYMLLHAIGGRSEDLDPMQTYRARFEDNGILDFLKERRADGTVRNLGSRTTRYKRLRLPYAPDGRRQDSLGFRADSAQLCRLGRQVELTPGNARSRISLPGTRRT